MSRDGSRLWSYGRPRSMILLMGEDRRKEKRFRQPERGANKR